MAISLNGGTGVITGVSVGGLPDGIVDADMLASSAVTTAKINDDAVTDAKQSLSGAAKAWVNFNGSGTVAIRDSSNVSSITDNGTGTYTVNFTTAMANANYVTLGTVEESGVSVHCSINNSVTQATSAVKIGTFLSGTSNGYDCDQVNVAVFGD